MKIVFCRTNAAAGSAMNDLAIYPDSKKHYPILDGLRGVASVLVVFFHVFEPFAGGNPFKQIISHGYLAVDFFFLLSGFVVAYAYDDRWSKMTLGDFFKRRLIRLQPLVVLGSLIGAALFYFQASAAFPLIADTPVWKTLLLMIVGCTLLPVPLSMDIRGWQEMHPLNGPAWSLFFEYIANILYAVIVRRFSKVLLSIFVAFAACLLIAHGVTGKEGDLNGGWTLNQEQLSIGFTRLLYPFFAGVLLCRLGKRIKMKHAFWWSSLLLVVVLSLPRFGDLQSLWKNGLYDALIVILIFPVIVSIGAGGALQHSGTTRISNLLGSLSYPLYITHFPLIYVYTAWVSNNHIPFGAKGLLVGLGVIIVSMLLAWVCLKFYDEPVREWLRKKLMAKNLNTK